MPRPLWPVSTGPTESSLASEETAANLFACLHPRWFLVIRIAPWIALSAFAVMEQIHAPRSPMSALLCVAIVQAAGCGHLHYQEADLVSHVQNFFG